VLRNQKIHKESEFSETTELSKFDSQNKSASADVSNRSSELKNDNQRLFVSSAVSSFEKKPVTTEISDIEEHHVR